MRKELIIKIVICFILSIGTNYAQDSTLTYSTGILVSAANSKTPYWLQSNQYGVIPSSGSFISGQVGISRIYNPGNPRFFQIGGGIQLIGNTGKTNSFFFTDLYVSLKGGPVELSIGQRQEVMGITDSLLTTGSFAMSGNARPYPRIKISTPGFVNIFPLNDIISFKFSYSDGLLGSSKISYGNVKEVPNVYLHQKSLYLRLGGLRHKISVYAGFNHQAMWGGEEKIFTGGLNTAEAYKYVILGKPWAGSRVGNHFGTIDAAAELRGRAWDILLYRQSIYEDGSLAKLSNIADGLNGLRFKRKNIDKQDLSFKINTVLLEFIYTKEQGGGEFDFDKGIFGRDNYFNHYVYRQGWSYRGRAMGTPLIGSQNMYRDDIPRDSLNFTGNNRIVALHVGLTGSWNKTDFLFKGTLSRNSGTYDFPFPAALTQTSFQLKAERPVSIWNKSLLSISLAADIGKLYTNNAAITLGWRKVGFLR